MVKLSRRSLYDKKSHNEFLVAGSQHRARANSPGLGHGLYLKDGYFCFKISTTLYSTRYFSPHLNVSRPRVGYGNTKSCWDDFSMQIERSFLCDSIRFVIQKLVSM